MDRILYLPLRFTMAQQVNCEWTAPWSLLTPTLYSFKAFAEKSLFIRDCPYIFGKAWRASVINFLPAKGVVSLCWGIVLTWTTVWLLSVTATLCTQVFLGCGFKGWITGRIKIHFALKCLFLEIILLFCTLRWYILFIYHMFWERLSWFYSVQWGSSCSPTRKKVSINL